MNQSKAFLTSFIFAMIGMLLVYFYVEDQTARVEGKFGDKVTVVYAKGDIKEFEEISDKMLETRTVPSSYALPGAQKSIEAFVGTVAAVPIKQGEQMMLTKVLLKGAETGISSQIAISRRAISVQVDDVSGVTRLLKPGDRVDLIANIQYSEQGKRYSEVKTFLQNIHVLAVGEQIQNHIPAAFERDPVSGNRRAIQMRGNRAFNTVTVEVTPEEAQQIIWVTEEGGGKIMMTLRNPVDRVIASVPTNTIDEVLGPNSQRAQRRRIQPAPKVLPRPKVIPKKNPWVSGGGSLAQ